MNTHRLRYPLIDLASYEGRYVTPPQLATFLECDARTVRRMCETGALRAIKVGRDWRIPIDDAREKFHVQQTSRRTA